MRRPLALIVPLVAVAVLAAAHPQPPAPDRSVITGGANRPVAATAALRHATSANWSGWDDVGGRYASVSASWVQPAVSCALLQASYVSFWVGLDGDGSSTVQQTGTEADCSVLGAATYAGWYEFYPAAPVYYSEPVRPGDAMSASVVSLGSSRYRVTLRDVTRGWVKVTDGTVRGARNASAEVIAEAPSSGATGRVLPLADFRAVTFTGATVNGRSLGGTATPRPITMASGAVVKAVPSGLTGGTRFAVTWRHR